MARRHKWLANTVTGVVCDKCDMLRRRPASAIRRGRPCVSDWEYWIDGCWQRSVTVPLCPGFKLSDL